MADLFDAQRFFRWNPASQRYDAVGWRRAILPGWLTIAVTDQEYPFLLPAAASGAAKALHVQPSYGSAQGADSGLGNPFEIRKIMFADSTDTTAASVVKLKMRDNSMGRDLMNRPIHIRLVAGTAQLPFRMLEPYFMQSNAALSLYFEKLSGGAVYFRFYFGGAHYFSWAPGLSGDDERQVKNAILQRINRSRFVMPYWLTFEDADTKQLAGNASGTYYLKVGEDGHFEALAMMAISTGAFNFQISEVVTKGTIANGYACDENSLGTAKLPFFFPAPWLVPGGKRLRVDITDVSGSTNDIYFAIFGRRIYAPITKVDQVLRQTVVETPADAGRVEVPPPLAYA